MMQRLKPLAAEAEEDVGKKRVSDETSTDT